jgi:hypothetical protein
MPYIEPTVTHIDPTEFVTSTATVMATTFSGSITEKLSSTMSSTTITTTSTVADSTIFDFESLEGEFWLPSSNGTEWINPETIEIDEIVKIRALAWIYILEMSFALFGLLFAWGYRLCDTGDGPDPLLTSIGAGLTSYTIFIGGLLGFLSIKFNSIINLEVSIYANVISLLLSFGTIGALIWSICASSSHAAYQPASGHTNRFRKSSIFMITFLFILVCFTISVISLTYSFKL